jgi:hypothetical protein
MATCHRVQWWKPKSWQRRLHSMKHVCALANAFHNLALYASRDMRGFKEERFWEEMERYANLYPKEAEWTNYKQLFEERLADENKTW